MKASQFKTQPVIQCSENAINIFQYRLHDLSRHLGLSELLPNQFNVCSLSLNEEHWMHISYSAEDMQVHWTSAMACVAFKDTKSLAYTLLAVNLDWQLTQGGFFAFDEITKVIFYQFHEPISNLNTPRFIEITERFIERSGFWRKRLQATIDQLPVLGNEVSVQSPNNNHRSLHHTI